MEKQGVTIDDLAGMVKQGFDEMHRKFGGEFNGIKGEIKELKEGQERIELRLSNVAYRFEIQEVQSRLKVVEDKLGIGK